MKENPLILFCDALNITLKISNVQVGFEILNRRLPYRGCLLSKQVAGDRVRTSSDTGIKLQFQTVFHTARHNIMSSTNKEI